MAKKSAIEISGGKALRSLFKDKAKMKLAEKIVKTNGEEMQRQMVKNTAYFTGHVDSSGNFKRPTGATKRSITGNWDAAKLRFTAGPTTHYSPYVNFGTRFMMARPFVTNAFNKQKELFKKDLNRAKG